MENLLRLTNLLIVTFQIFKLSLFRSKMSYDLKKAEYDAEVNTAKAEADLAYDLKVSAEKGNHHKTPPLNWMFNINHHHSNIYFQAAIMQQRIKQEAFQVPTLLLQTISLVASNISCNR